MNIEVLTIFPEIFSGFLSCSLINKAITRGLVSIELTDIRDFSDPPHYQVDDTPYGGGAGMVLRAEPIMKSIEAARAKYQSAHVACLTPAGKPLTQRRAHELSQLSSLVLLCGRYEGIDQRAIDLGVDEELSIGDYVVMGGEVPAMVVIESCVRLRSDVIGNKASLVQESFSLTFQEGRLVEAPHYTRPEDFRGKRVPEVLLSGNHRLIEEWRLSEARRRTKARSQT